MVRAGEGSEGLPRVLGHRPYASPEPDLQVGDALLRVGEVDLRGATAFSFQIDAIAAANEPVVENDSNRGDR